jgi:hypothetical protein
MSGVSRYNPAGNGSIQRFEYNEKPDVAITQRRPQESYLLLDSVDRYNLLPDGNYDFSNLIPLNNLYINHQKLNGFGEIKRGAVVEVSFPWTTPNVNERNNRLFFQKTDDSSNPDQSIYYIQVPEGFYKPSELAAAMVTAFQDPFWWFDQTGVNNRGDPAPTEAEIVVITNSPVTNIFNFEFTGSIRFILPPINCIAVPFGGEIYVNPTNEILGGIFNAGPVIRYQYVNLSNTLMNVIGLEYYVTKLTNVSLTPTNSAVYNATFSDELFRGGIPTMAYTKYIDFVSDNLNKHQKLKDGLTQFNYTNVLYRLYLDNELAMATTNDNYFGSRPVVNILRQVSAPKYFEWNKNEMISAIDMKLYDDSGELLYVPIKDINQNYLLTLHLSES